MGLRLNKIQMTETLGVGEQLSYLQKQRLLLGDTANSSGSSIPNMRQVTCSS